MKPCILFVIFLIFFPVQLISQEEIAIKNNNDSILKAYTKKKKETHKKEPDVIFLSFKSGYQYAESWYDKGLKGSWVADVSFGAIMNNKWVIGINFDYWKTTIKNYQIAFSNTIYDRDYKASGVSLFLKYKIPVYKNVFDIDLGSGIGTYGISYKSIFGNYEKTDYLNLNLRLGFNIKIIDFFISSRNLCVNISSEIAYFYLITLAENKSLYKTYNFKIGPSINLFY